ncbi:hypothetical protein ACF0H5_012640 [Mactra antiquata]
MGLGIGGKCGMFFLITVNILFLLLGLGLLIVGIIMRVDTDIIDKTEVTSTLNEVSLNGNLKLGNVTSSLSILVICVGSFILLVAFLGACGACCKNKCLLVTYAIIVLLIFIVQIVIVALWFIMKDKVENTVKEELRKAMNKYDGIDSNKEVSIGWDLLFIGFDCCGVDGVGPSNQNEFEGSDWWIPGAPYVPYSCCIDATEDNYKTGSNANCANLSSGYQAQGCYDAFKDFLKKYETAALAIGIVLLVIELVAIIFAFLLCRAIGKDDMIV